MPTRWSDDITVSELADEPALSEELGNLIAQIENQAQRASHAVLNFNDVTYVNSSNLGQLLTLRKKLLESGRFVVMCGVCDEVMAVIRVTGLDRVFRFAPDPLTALAMLQIADE